MRERVTVRVPATTANLGPGFDCLAMALNIWNTVTVEVGSSGFSIKGFGGDRCWTLTRVLVPPSHIRGHPGLVFAFELAGQGRSDREVAQVLNARGYRTVGNRGNRPFGNSSVRHMLTNRFYLGYLPDGERGWIEGPS